MELSFRLLRYAQKGSKQARIDLEESFLHTAMSVIKRILVGLEISLLEPEDYLLSYHKAFLKCIDLYDNNKGNFESFLIKVLTREVNSDLKAYLDYQKGLLSLDEITSENGGSAHDVVPSYESFENNPSIYVQENELADLVLKKHYALSKKEAARNKIQRDYIMLIFSGFKKTEIYGRFKYCATTMRKIIKDDGPHSIIRDLKDHHHEIKNLTLTKYS